MVKLAFSLKIRAALILGCFCCFIFCFDTVFAADELTSASICKEQNQANSDQVYSNGEWFEPEVAEIRGVYLLVHGLNLKPAAMRDAIRLGKTVAVQPEMDHALHVDVAQFCEKQDAVSGCARG